MTCPVRRNSSLTTSYPSPNIPAGSHLLTVVNHRYNFDMIRLDITDDTILASLTHNGASWDTLGPITMYPLALQAKAKYEFFAKREGFNAWSILSNPMILMSGVTLLMVFVMPKMMANMPEEVKQGASGGQQQVQQPETPQISMPDISQNLANWFAPKPQTSTGPTSANRRRA
ncbi:hypothetical protein DFS34DRAFT_618743 [Phlyctochytrium arcticum]|nr:hypothetical protein DFS34DRAFT_618743 [Phlyctochytrium arcticum]